MSSSVAKSMAARGIGRAKTHRLACVAALWLVTVIDARAQTPPAVDTAAAVVEGTAISMQALNERYESMNATALARLRRQMEDLRRATLDQMITELVVSKAAAKRGTSETELLSQSRGTIEVTEAELLQLYHSIRAPVKPAFDVVRPEMQRFLENQKNAETAKKIVQRLVGEAAVSIHSSLEPARSVVNVESSDPRTGTTAAPIQIVEFGDFECPFCLRAASTLRELASRFSSFVSFIWKDFPLSNHSQAQTAAEAAACAGDGGRFWQFHDRLFTEPLKLGAAELRRHAAESGLNISEFDQCLASGRHRTGIVRDVAEAKRLNVTATPTTFINGLRIEGAVPLEEYVRIIEQEIRRKAGTPK